MKNTRQHFKTRTMKSITILILSTIVLNTMSCQNPNNKSESSNHIKWDYSGESGPEYWAQLESDSECGGKHQSPINILEIETTPGNSLDKITGLNYQDNTSLTSITNNGHTIQYNFDGELNKFVYEDKEYKMKQFHFHAPSEHTLNGIRYPLEIHLVHHNEKSNSYVVFAFLVRQGKSDPTFTFLEKFLPIKEGETKDISITYNLGTTVKDVFGLDSVQAFTYDGSLTTPPCTERVHWIVFKNASTASASQIKMLEDLMPKNNYRDVQPSNDRMVYSETLTELFETSN